jgi:hypothetical protein
MGMTEIEQLRKELNELRERIAVIEMHTVTWPVKAPANPPVWAPPYTVTCGVKDAK